MSIGRGLCRVAVVGVLVLSGGTSPAVGGASPADHPAHSGATLDLAMAHPGQREPTTQSQLSGATELLAAAWAAASEQPAADETSTTRVDGKAFILEVIQAGRLDGLKRLTAAHGVAPSATESIILMGTVAYLRATALDLEQDMNFPPAVAHRESSKWVEFDSTAGTIANLEYYTISGGMTMASIVSSLPRDTDFIFVPSAVVNGQRVLGVQRTLAGSAFQGRTLLYVRASNPQLPVELITTGGSGGERVSITTTFGPWGQIPIVSTATDFSPVAATRTPQGRPREAPADGHWSSPGTVTEAPRGRPYGSSGA